MPSTKVSQNIEKSSGRDMNATGKAAVNSQKSRNACQNSNNPPVADKGAAGRSAVNNSKRRTNVNEKSEDCPGVDMSATGQSTLNTKRKPNARQKSEDSPGVDISETGQSILKSKRATNARQKSVDSPGVAISATGQSALNSKRRTKAHQKSEDSPNAGRSATIHSAKDSEKGTKLIKNTETFPGADMSTTGQSAVNNSKKRVNICDKSEDSPEADMRITEQSAVNSKICIISDEAEPSEGQSMKKLKCVVQMLKLKMSDISSAAERVNMILEDFLFPVFLEHPLFSNIEKMSTGSYYEKVKISKPNEFDIMLKINVERIDVKPFDECGGFYTIAPKRRSPNHPLYTYLDKDGNISGKKMLSNFREIIKEGIQNSGMNITIEEEDPKSPAITILVKENSNIISIDLVLALEGQISWPKETKDGMKIDSWLGTKVKKDLRYLPPCFVAKQVRMKKKTKVLWRISFSHIEKNILENHGNAKTCCEREGTKCCRKQCLKLLKCLLDLLKNEGKLTDEFCSYHAKTAMMQSCTMWPKDEQWKPEDLAICFDRYIQYFLTCLQNAELPNFFIPSYNLLSKPFVKKASLKDLYREIKSQQTQNYPLFDKLIK